MISLVTICHHTKILHNYWLYSLHYIFHRCDSFILYLKSPSSVSLLPSALKQLSSGNHLFVLYLWVCFCFIMFVHLLCFLDPHVNEIILYLSFSIWLILLSIIFSGSICVWQMVRFYSFLWLNNIQLYILHLYPLKHWWTFKLLPHLGYY